MITRWNLDELTHSEDELYHHGVIGMRWGHRKQEPSSGGSNRMKRRLNVTVGYDTSGAAISASKTVSVDRKKYNRSRVRGAAGMGVYGAAMGAALASASGSPKAMLIGAAAGASGGALLGGTKKFADMSIESVMSRNVSHNAAKMIAKRNNWNYSNIDKAIAKNNKYLRDKFGINEPKRNSL